MSTTDTARHRSSSLRSSRSHRGIAVRAGLGLATVAGVVAAGLGGVGIHSAQADSSHLFGTANLMQGNDIGSVKDNVGELNFQQTDLYGARSISACTGESSFDTLTGDKTLVTLGSSWSNSDGESDGLVTEAIAQAKSPAAAKSSALKVLKALQTCQHEPAGHWRYGKTYHGPLQNGDHVWMDAIDGRGRVTGGVAVMLQGSRFGVVEVSSAVGDGDDAIKNTVLPAEDRLAG